MKASGGLNYVHNTAHYGSIRLAAFAGVDADFEEVEHTDGYGALMMG